MEAFRMSNAPKIDWSGKSGQSYTYWIFPIGADFVEKPGNYIFAKQTRPGYWTPVYIGQTNDLHCRLANHEKVACAKRNGATHIHAHATEGTEQARLNEEKDLIARWTPPCNDRIPS